MTDRINNQQADEWIRILDLKPHVEGGFYSETYQSKDQCLMKRQQDRNRLCSTAIYYLLCAPDSPRSRFHRIQADEMWHFYKGDPLIVHVLDETDSSHEKLILGNDLSLANDSRPQLLVPYGKWFAAELMTISNDKDNYTLCGCTCTPGFDFEYFEVADRSYLLTKFPHLTELITRLTPSS